MKPYNIIFVCTGNACRSPFAETIMKKLLLKSNLQIQVCSAGTLDWGSNQRDKEMIEVAKEMGVQFSDYNGNLTSRECGSVGGEMVKRMVEQYEKNL